jgi:hypothetical protein
MRRLSFNFHPIMFLAGSLLAVSAFAGHSALAAQDQGFAYASLQGSYAYVNNTGNVASLGPITFDGRGGLSVDIIANLPCVNPAVNCSRGINDLPPATGTYIVEADGTGITEIEFSTAKVTYNFMIFEATKNGTTLLATKIFAAGRSGGLNGQLIAPTWSRILVK